MVNAIPIKAEETLNETNLINYKWYKKATNNNDYSTGILINTTSTTQLNAQTSYQISLSNSDSSYYYVIAFNSNNCTDTTNFTNKIEIATPSIIQNTSLKVNNRRYCYNINGNSDVLQFNK